MLKKIGTVINVRYSETSVYHKTRERLWKSSQMNYLYLEDKIIYIEDSYSAIQIVFVVSSIVFKCETS